MLPAAEEKRLDAECDRFMRVIHPRPVTASSSPSPTALSPSSSPSPSPSPSPQPSPPLPLHPTLALSRSSTALSVAHRAMDPRPLRRLLSLPPLPGHPLRDRRAAARAMLDAQLRRLRHLQVRVGQRYDAQLHGRSIGTRSMAARRATSTSYLAISAPPSAPTIRSSPPPWWRLARATPRAPSSHPAGGRRAYDGVLRCADHGDRARRRGAYPGRPSAGQLQ